MPGLIQELKRRNVFKVGTAYVVLAWLVAQATDVFLDPLGAPPWVIRTILILLIAGLPLVLLFAWAYEMTPEGLKREKDVDRSQSVTQRTGQKLNLAVIFILVLALGYFAFDKFVLEPARHPEVSGAEPEPVPQPDSSAANSIAVLPFVNMSSDAEQEYFSDGISEEILNSLAQVKDLRVAGRTSSFAFKGQNQDLRQIGETLGVDHILEGSVRKSGAKIRVTAQLIQVEDGFHLWSDTYDRELTDVFAIQDEIANAILEQLKAHLVDSEAASALPAAERTDPEVYDLYLLARQRTYERKGPSIEAAADLLDTAIARDPEYAPAYAQRGIAALLMSEANYGAVPVTEALAQGKLYLDKALALDPELAEAWAGLGLYHNNRPGEHLESIEALEKALSINPNLIDASNWLQIAYSELGDLRRSLEIIDGMVERDPLYPPGFSNAINLYNQFGMQEKSWALLERMRPFIPGDPQLLQAEANIWLSLGRPSRALPLVEQAHDAQPTDFVINNLRSVGLLQTAQFERIVNDEGSPWAQVIALFLLDRNEEAGILAAELDAAGNAGILLTYLYLTRQFAPMTELIESRWGDLESFEAAFPDGGDGYGLMLNVASAYSRQGEQARHEEAMRRVRAAHNRAMEQNPEGRDLLLDEARYYVMNGDPDRAVAYLEKALDHHLIFSVALHRIWPELESLRGDPRYEAVLDQLRQRVTAERAELGLDALST